MKILALEFSSSKRSVAVGEGGEVRGYAEMDRGLATPALGLVAQALAQSGWSRGEIDCVAVGLGPGSYAGIRMALAIAQGFAMTGRVQGIGVSSALAAASLVPDLGVRGEFQIVVDAQRGEFYAAGFSASATGSAETAPLRIVQKPDLCHTIATGRTAYGPDLAKLLPEARPLWPDARSVLRLASRSRATEAMELLKPIYLRETTFVKVGGRV